MNNSDGENGFSSVGIGGGGLLRFGGGAEKCLDFPSDPATYADQESGTRFRHAGRLPVEKSAENVEAQEDDCEADGAFGPMIQASRKRAVIQDYGGAENSDGSRVPQARRLGPCASRGAGLVRRW